MINYNFYFLPFFDNIFYSGESNISKALAWKQSRSVEPAWTQTAEKFRGTRIINLDVEEEKYSSASDTVSYPSTTDKLTDGKKDTMPAPKGKTPTKNKQIKDFSTGYSNPFTTNVGIYGGQDMMPIFLTSSAPQEKIPTKTKQTKDFSTGYTDPIPSTTNQATLGGQDILPIFSSSKTPQETIPTKNRQIKGFRTGHTVAIIDPFTQNDVAHDNMPYPYSAGKNHAQIPGFLSTRTFIVGQKSKQNHEHNVEDIILGGFTILMIITNLLSNVPAFVFFLRKKGKSPDLFYSAISAADIGTSLCAIPVVISLMNYRNSVLFTDSLFCETWFVVFSTLTKVSMFLVMILNIFRTIALVYPFYDIHSHDKKIIPATLIYLATLSVIDTTYLCTKKGEVVYRKALSFCQMQPNLKVPSDITYTNAYSGLYQIEVLTPMLIVLVCFVVIAISLARSSSKMNENQKKFRKITVTIAIFTAVFLICNLPHLAEQILYLATGFDRRVFKERIMKNTSLWQKYGHFTTKFLLTQLNSVLNPCLYLARMPQFRAWLRHWKRKVTEQSARR